LKLILFLENFWQAKENRKQFFENFAKANNFNPLTPENWYRINKEDVINADVCGFLYIFIFLFIVAASKKIIRILKLNLFTGSA
jgi:hypothetical protein